MYLFYDFLLILITPFLVLYHLYSSLTAGRPAAFKPRFGLVDPSVVRLLDGRRPIWVHAVSVGETITVKPLLAALKAEYPDVPLILSNMTETGRELAGKIPTVDACVYFPFDYPFAVGRLLKSVNPRLLIVVETELWPNFLLKARKLGIPLMIVNGRISDRSYGRYLTLKMFFAPLLKNVMRFCMQSRLDAERIISIGAPESGVTVTRNLKFDLPVRSCTDEELAGIRARFRIDESCRILTVGSTRPGEEEQVLDAFSRITAGGRDLMLILVPRHPERAGEVGELLESRRFPYRKRSLLSDGSPLFQNGEVLLVDTVGELMPLYAIADVVFVGGSLVPTGGHNLLEPASLGRPVLFGKHMTNFREIAARTLEYEAGIQIDSAEGLAEAVSVLLADDGRRRLIGDNGRRMLQEQGGATELNMAEIRSLLAGHAKISGAE